MPQEWLALEIRRRGRSVATGGGPPPARSTGPLPEADRTTFTTEGSLQCLLGQQRRGAHVPTGHPSLRTRSMALLQVGFLQERLVALHVGDELEALGIRARSATSATRSVPDRWSGDVISTGAPMARHTSATSAESVATTAWSRIVHRGRHAARPTRSTVSREARRGASGGAGSTRAGRARCREPGRSSG